MTDDGDKDFDDGYPLWETLSLCIDCVRHESLKAFIQTYPSQNDRCGACLRTAPAAIVCTLSERERLSFLLRASAERASAQLCRMNEKVKPDVGRVNEPPDNISL